MRAEMELISEDVFGLPGQNLTADELLVLVALANGNSPDLIGHVLNADSRAIRYIESSIKNKLGAKTHPHMITRGFTLGLLMSQALCLLLCIMSVAELNQDFTRPRSQRRARTMAEHSRTYRLNSGAVAGGPPHQLTVIV